MRKNIAAGNWKMNLTAPEAEALADAVIEGYAKLDTDAQVIFGPAAPFLPMITPKVAGQEGVFVSAQNVYQEEKGAYTGEYSASMLTSVGATHVIIGHSERRQYFGEGNALLASKIDIALKHGLVPIYCVGETLDQREADQAMAVNKTQIEEGAFHLSAEDFGKLIIAYEPVWAIGTGKTATPEQAQEVHAYIRSLIVAKYGESVANDTSILYGGSVKPANAKELFAQADIDGGLVGGASLKPADFLAIIDSF
ncbi:MAG: triose-phosphate isomerase [Bacteroidota bacterium]